MEDSPESKYFDPLEKSLLMVWENYTMFESLQRNPGDDLRTFVSKWQRKKQVAESVGCQYSDLVLTCKLLEKANLPDEFIVSLLSEIEPTAITKGSVLDEISTRIMRRDSTNESDLHTQEDSHPEDRSNDVCSTFIVKEEPDVKPVVADSSQRLTLTQCPQCTNSLTRGSESGHNGHLDILNCDDCGLQLFVRMVLRNKKFQWEYLVLPKCPKCSRFIEFKPKQQEPKDEDLEETSLICKVCDIFVNSVFFDNKLISLEEALAKKTWAKVIRQRKPAAATTRRKLIRNTLTAPTVIAVKKRKRRAGKPESFQCEICGKQFKNAARMQLHHKAHKSEKLFKCQFCNKAYNKPSKLKVHVNVHTAENLYVCSFCNKEFTRYSSYAQHVNIHTKARSYDCKDCDAKFVHQSSLTYHIRIHHTGEKPYKCDQCDWAFYSAFKLTQHKWIHTGEKPHKCKFCNKAFRLSGARNRHMRLHCKANGGVVVDPDSPNDIKPTFSEEVIEEETEEIVVSELNFFVAREDDV